MVLKRKVELEKVIEKGGKVAGDSEKKDWVNFTLRIRNDMITAIDEALNETVGISKTGWILQAIQEKLKRKE